ncbi:DNA helicase, partial [Tanacetum coccineum]
SSAFVGGVGDGLDKRKLQPSGHSDVFQAYLDLCSSGAGSRLSFVCGPSASLPGRSFHANPNTVMITADSQNSYPISRDGGNTQENCQLRSTIGVSNNGSSASCRCRNVQVRPRLNSAVGVQSTSTRIGRRVLTSGSTVDTNSVGPHIRIVIWETVIGDAVIVGLLFGGRIHMQPPHEPPEYIKSLFENKHFMENICAYNQMFAMTSFGAKIDESINAGRGPELDIPKFKMWLYNAEGARGYELPTSNTLGAMVFENGISDNADFDVIIQHRDGPPQRVNKLHPLYMSLQFPLLFIYGQPGYHTERDVYEVGGRIILLMSFTVCPRYMYAHYLDALAICRELGNPQFFITFTCNVNWPEIKRFMSEYPHLTASDRADVVCRVFEQKIQALIAFLKEERIFGDVTGVLYTVEFQKRGLPHCHTLLWVDSASRIRIVEDADRFI